MTYEKLPAIEGSTACLTCGCGSHNTLPMDAMLAVGFGSCNVTKDDECVYSKQEQDYLANKRRKGKRLFERCQLVGWEAYWEAKDAEEIAAKDPDHDWRISFYAPLYEAEYQRQGENHWVLVRKGEGFA
jgi:hypothetical protein